MQIIRFEKTQLLNVELETLWEFCSNPNNLPLITPPDLCFNLTSPVPKNMYPGIIVTYTVAPFAHIKVKWVTEITHLVYPSLFVDEQRFGPYSFWHHQHHFTKIENSVQMQDIVHYSIPFDPFSRIISGLVASRLEYIFDYRRRALETMFDAKIV